MKIYRIVLTVVIVSLCNLALGQDLPAIESTHEVNLDGKKELIRITYNDSCYYLNGKQMHTIKSIKDSICPIIKSKNIGYVDIPTGYVSIYLNKKTEISVLDSIINELQGLNLLTVYYKLSGKENNGYLLRLPISSELKIEYFKNNGFYYPGITEWISCLVEENNEDECVEEIIQPISLEKPKDILLRLRNSEMKGYENDNDIYLLKVNGDSLIIDGAKVNSKYISDSISNILEKGNYSFVIEMSSDNTYDDYIRCLYYVISEIERKREKYALNLTESGKNMDNSEYVVRSKYPIRLRSVFPSDSKFLSNSR